MERLKPLAELVVRIFRAQPGLGRSQSQSSQQPAEMESVEAQDSAQDSAYFSTMSSISPEDTTTTTRTFNQKKGPTGTVTRPLLNTVKLVFTREPLRSARNTRGRSLQLGSTNVPANQLLLVRAGEETVLVQRK